MSLLELLITAITEDFLKYQDTSQLPHIEPLKVDKIIRNMNKKAATVPGDLPIKLIAEFSVELSFPLALLSQIWCLP